MAILFSCSRCTMLVTACCFLSFIACTESPISGKIDWQDADFKKSVYLISFSGYESLVSAYQGIVQDSASVDREGNFAFKKMLPNGMYALTIQKVTEKYKNNLLNEDPNFSNYVPFVYEGTPIRLSASANQFQKSARWENPSEANRQISELISSRNNAFNLYLANLETVNEENLIEQHKAQHDFRKILFDFAFKTDLISVGLLAMRWATPDGDFERSSDELYGFCKKWQDKANSNTMAEQLCARVNKGSLAARTGDLFPDFALPMLDGSEQKVQSMLGTRLTIIDLWASWCGPCRIENKKILGPLWEKYHDMGLQIIGYALDADDRSWKNAITKDAADRWLHSSHLLGDESPLFQTLGISTIPANYLLDKEGHIIAKNLHGKELEEWVAKYFEK